jgi:hypothetical protein
MAGTRGEDGTIDWTVLGRVLDQEGAPATNFNFRAQFYLGKSLSVLGPVGNSLRISIESPLAPDTPAGIVTEGFWRIPDLQAGQEFVVQLRAWDSFYGSTYESARKNGGAFGRSKIISLRAGSEMTGFAVLEGLGDVVLQDGIPNFSSPVLAPESISSEGIKWKLSGPAGFIYNIERTDFSSPWETVLTVTNTAETTFTDSAAQQHSFSFYRAKIVD